MSHHRDKLKQVTAPDIFNHGTTTYTHDSVHISNSFTRFDSSESIVSGLSLRQTRKRGPTRNIGLLALRPGERVPVSFNEYGQVVNEIKGCRLKSYLGTLVRNQDNVPLQVNGWKSVPIDDKEKIWALVLEKFDVEEDRKDYILSLAGGKYRSYRSKMKASYYKPWATNEERLRHKPPLVSDADWRWLVQFWSSEEAQAISKRNKKNRAKQKINHTSGSKSFAQLRYEQARLREDGTHTQTNKIHMFKLTHKRKDETPVDNASREIMTTSHRRGKIKKVTTSDIFNNGTTTHTHDTVHIFDSHTRPDNSESSVSGLSLRQTRKRGPTRNIGLLALRSGERVPVSFNEYGQVVNEIKGRRLKSYLGTLVRNQHNVPLQVNGWKSVPVDDKEKIWVLVLEKFDVEEDRKDYILSLVGDKYRSYRSKMKATYYESWATNEERLRHKPPLVSDADWRWLVQFWSSEEAQVISKRNKKNRAKQKINHTSGSKSFAQLRYEQARLIEDGAHTQPNRICMFKLTHTRKDGTPVDDASREIMAKFEEILVAQTLSQMGESSSSSPLSMDSMYTQVMGLERHGRVRGFGFGATPTLVFGATSKKEANAILASKLKETEEEINHVKQHEEQMQLQIQFQREQLQAQQGQLQQQQGQLQQQEEQMEMMQRHMQQMQTMMNQMLQFQQGKDQQGPSSS